MSLSTALDLVILAADKDLEEALQGLLPRSEALGIRPLTFKILVHPRHDAGCRRDGVGFLRNFVRQYRHALLMFDWEGCGTEKKAAEEIESFLESDLSRNGWADRSATIITTPELESWIWSDSPEVDRICGWQGRIPALRDWLVEEKYLTNPHDKPARPKEAFRHALKAVSKQPSSALFRKLASRVAFARCTDRALLKLVATLQEWFPPAPPN